MKTSRTQFRFPRARKSILAVSALAGLGLASVAHAEVLYTGAGANAETGHTGQSATALFSLATNAITKLQTLTLTLTNTADKTRDQGDALTGILFNFSGKESLSLSSITVGSGSQLSRQGEGESEDGGSKSSLSGTWTDKLSASPVVAANYGLSTTTFGSEFQNRFSQGSSNSDYGLIGANSSVEDIKNSHSPYVLDSITFKINVSGGTLSEDDLGKVSFLYGSSGKGLIAGSPALAAAPDLALAAADTPSSVPEPASLALVALALGASLLARRRRLESQVAVKV